METCGHWVNSGSFLSTGDTIPKVGYGTADKAIKRGISVINLEKIVSTIRDLKEEIEKKYRADIVGIFGSVVKGEQREGSDIDVLVEFHEDATLFDFARLSLFLQEELGVDVDVVPRDTIREELRGTIMSEVINV